MTLLEGLALLSLAFWSALILDRGRRWPRECSLPSGEEEAGKRVDDRVVAVVPARNEAVLLPATLPSLLGQEVPALRVILVDDGSSDGTAEVARRVARASGHERRLEVVTAPPTPPGWSGKVWALAAGVASLGGEEAPEWLLFTDADIEHRPGAVGALLEQAGREAEGASFDLLSVMARLRAETFWERLLIPPFVFFFQLLYPFRRVQNSRSRVAAAAGGCVLVRQRLLEESGGLEGISGALIDDVALAKQVKRAGGRLWLGFDPGIRSLRAYERLSEIWRMVARSAYDQLDYRPVLLVVVIAGLLLLVAAPPLLAALGIYESATAAASPSLRKAVVWAVLAWGLEALALLPSVRHHRVPWVYALGLPLAAVLYALMTASSAWSQLTAGGTRWKGRPTSRRGA